MPPGKRVSAPETQKRTVSLGLCIGKNKKTRVRKQKVGRRTIGRTCREKKAWGVGSYWRRFGARKKRKSAFEDPASLRPERDPGGVGGQPPRNSGREAIKQIEGEEKFDTKKRETSTRTHELRAG